MRAIWTGAITFGLVNVPVKVYSATEDHDVQLHQVHDADGGRIRYQRRCEIDGKIIPYEHIAKAFEAGDKTIILTDEDLASLPAERSREIDVVEFVPSDQIDPIMFDRSYYLEPDSKSVKAYTLLRRTLEDADRTAIFPALDERTRLTERELDLSNALMESFAGDFAPEKYADEYQEELRKLIDAKLERGDAVDTAETFGEEAEKQAGGGEVIDLMEALQRSVERSRASKKPAKAATAKKRKPA
jgi:DNA end-binding protein Ku